MKLTLAFIFTILLPHTAVLAQGPLTPPSGAPAPTMKTLDQVEPRVDIATLPSSTGSVGSQHRIVESGSYYLSGDIFLEPGRTIALFVDAPHVTIDLNGFSIIATGSESDDTTGIRLGVAAEHITIKNGGIANFDNGIERFVSSTSGGILRDLQISGTQNHAINLDDNYIVEHCIVRSSSGNGIRVRHGSAVRHCTVEGATTQFGIRTGDHSYIEHCRVFNVSSARGIDAGDGVSLTYCIVEDSVNSDTALFAGEDAMLAHCISRNNTTRYGIRVGDRAMLSDTTSLGNTFNVSLNSYGIFTGEDSMLTRVSAIGTRNTASVGIHRGAGIGAAMGSTVRYSTAVDNAGNGIAIGREGVIEHNLIRRNGRNDNDAGAAGVYASSFRSLIRNNHIVDNTIGIRIISWPNVVIGNTLRGNGTQFDISSNNRVGEIVTVPASGAINGDSGGAGMGTTDPYANLSF